MLHTACPDFRGDCVQGSFPLLLRVGPPKPSTSSVRLLVVPLRQAPHQFNRVEVAMVGREPHHLMPVLSYNLVDTVAAVRFFVDLGQVQELLAKCTLREADVVLLQPLCQCCLLPAASSRKKTHSNHS